MNMKLNRIMTAAFCLMFLACGNGGDSGREKKEEKPVPVETAIAFRGAIEATFSGSTALEAENEASVVAKVSGIVERILVEEGDKVEAGTVLALIEPEQYRLRMEQARASMVKLEKEYERSRSLHQENIVSKESFDRIKYDYDNQKAVYDLARYELDQTRITAPIDGIVTKRLIKIGNQIQNTQELFHISDFSPILAVLHVPEKELSRMELGQKAAIVPDALPNLAIPGFIKLINPAINPQTGTVKITIEINDPDARLKPGMFARIHVVTDIRQDALLIPRDGLVSEDSEHYVFLVQNNDGKRTVSKQTVQIGYTDSKNVEIVQGLKEGGTIVTIGHISLKDGSVIEVIENEKNN